MNGEPSVWKRLWRVLFFFFLKKQNKFFEKIRTKEYFYAYNRKSYNDAVQGAITRNLVIIFLF